MKTSMAFKDLAPNAVLLINLMYSKIARDYVLPSDPAAAADAMA